jgi:hypothetical protein
VIFGVLFTTGFFGERAFAQGTLILNRLAGRWTEDESKQKIGSINLRFRRTAAGGIEELRGPDLAPDVQTIDFDGLPRLLNTGRSIAWKQIDANTFERRLSEGQRLLTTRDIRISRDGRSLTEKTVWNLADNKTRLTTVVYRRSSGEPRGLAALWKAQSIRSSPPDQWTYERTGSNALTFMGFNGQTYTVSLDGTAVPVTGGATLLNMMIAAIKVDDYTIETTSSRNGIVTDKSRITISANGKTITIVSTDLGPNASLGPSIAVYDKR